MENNNTPKKVEPKKEKKEPETIYEAWKREMNKPITRDNPMNS